MASLIRDKARGAAAGHTYRIQFCDGQGQRLAVYLGRTSLRVAEEWRSRVEQLVAAKIGGVALSADLAAWLRDLPATAHGKLAHVGLVGERVKAEVVTLEQTCQRFLDSAVAKPGTVLIWRQCIDSMLRFFGASTPINSITPEQGDGWKKWLSEPHETIFGRSRTKAIRRLAVATQAKRLVVGKQIFRCAVRWGLMEKNPLDGIRGGSNANSSRAFYVTPQMIAAIIDNCPNVEWRLIFALARYAGLRCPSEVAGLSWQDVNWEQSGLRVRSPKTEHHAGGDSRMVPITPPLMAILDGAFVLAPDGATLIVPGYQKMTANLRTQGIRVIEAAGLKPWPKLFQNMRSSRETEWLEEFPIKAVASWMGHSELVSLKHYAQILPEHFISATGKIAHADCSAPNPQNAAQQGVMASCMKVDKKKKTVLPSEGNTVLSGKTEVLGEKRIGAERFELSTSWSQTRRATNCATLRRRAT